MTKKQAKTLHVCILEDDPVAAGICEQIVSDAGWSSTICTTLAEANKALKQEPFNLLLLDWSLPDGDAGKLVRRIRKTNGWDIPILIISASDDEQQIVAALETGVDDYLTKPLRRAEAQARIRAWARRADPITPGLPVGYVLDDKARDVLVAGEWAGLSGLEYDLAVYMLPRQNELLTREHLIKAVWSRDPGVDSRTVDTHVSRLRRKLRLEENNLAITTLRGYGYRFESAS